MTSCNNQNSKKDTADSPAITTGFEVEETWYTQPVDHDKPDGETLEEQVLYLYPEGLDRKSIKYILFGLGNEIDSDRHRIEWIWKSYGSPQDMLVILAEHRGYGQSQTKGDQSIPTYVTVKQTLKDYDRFIQDKKKEYPNAKWVGAGYSYGASLTLQFVHDYPQDLDIAIASSPPVYYPFYFTEYNQMIYKNLGKEFTDKMSQHMVNLKPIKVHDENWVNRELLGATLALMTQTTSFRKIEPEISKFIDLPTDEFMTRLKPMLPEAMTQMIDARKKESLTYEEAQTGKYNWYTWKWQQCYETGTQNFEAPFPHTKEEVIADYQASYGMTPPAKEKPIWDLRPLISEIKIPLIVTNGGADPWITIGIKPDHEYTNIDYIYNETAEHVPDLWYEETGLEVARIMRKHLEELDK